MSRTQAERVKEEKQIVTSFVRERASAYHEAFGISSPQNDIDTNTDHFSAYRDLQEVLEAYNATADKDRKLDLQRSTWEEVMSELNEAEELYVRKGKGAVNFVRKGFRIAGDYSAAITPWLGLIPHGNGLELLSAGLTLMFSIAKQNADNRGRILNAFHDIPAIILRTGEQQNQLASVDILRQQAINLYTVVVQALADLIFLFHGSKSGSFRIRAKRISKRLFAPTYTAIQIDEILQAVQQSVDEFKYHREMVQTQIAVDTYHNTVLIQHSTEQIFDSFSGLTYGVDKLHDSSEHTHVQLDGVQDQLSSIITELEASRTRQHSMYQPGMEAQAALCRFILNDFPTFLNAVTSMSTPMVKSQSFLSRMQLLNCLAVSPRASIDDVDIVLKQPVVFNAEGQSLSQQVLSSNEFLRWMQTSHAETLFVQGDCSIVGPGRVTPLSALCATLSLNLSKHSDSLVLHFFCGLHESPSSSTAGPSGLIRSLIAQLLLTRATFGLDFINTRAFAESICSHSVYDLCHTFRQLIEQLPKSAVVVCIIDGIVRFESDAWFADLMEVIHTLNQILANPALHPVIKLLVTSPYAQSGHTGRALMAHHRLTLRSGNGGNGYAITDRSLLSGMSRVDEYRLKVQANRRRLDSEEEDSEDEF
ncbi:hypothetical protein BDV25DRAFT_47977 [Aspergillus avenaceus]|uniref:Nephrocystin 3-like N-terminal domain-containing protein n=1 Tax=Aspergillus avenaceus TaxID=36643 RepID=A0A5N6U2Y6_ASPAV|nr:hypothetical protein BDV25DRAFT_47977 [Aspergillus avenaceus]